MWWELWGKFPYKEKNVYEYVNNKLQWAVETIIARSDRQWMMFTVVRAAEWTKLQRKRHILKRVQLRPMQSKRNGAYASARLVQCLTRGRGVVWLVSVCSSLKQWLCACVYVEYYVMRVETTGTRNAWSDGGERPPPPLLAVRKKSVATVRFSWWT